MYNSNVSISISDDSSDELASKLKPRVRRKRRKLGLRGKTQFSRQVIKRLLKLWPVLLFIPFAALLVFEGYRLGGKPNPLVKTSKTAVPQNKPVQHIVKKPPANLNRLDPLTRVVGGVRERKPLAQKDLFFYIIITVFILVLITSLHLMISTHIYFSLTMKVAICL